MTPLPLDAPLVGLLTLAGMTQEALARACTPRQSKQAVTVAAARGDRIRLSTLAAYARAAGYTLWLIGNGLPAWSLRLLVDERHTMSVEEARAVIDGWGLEMTLAVDQISEMEEKNV